MVYMCFVVENAAPEWQTRSSWWHSRELVVACPLEGLVGMYKATADLLPLESMIGMPLQNSGMGNTIMLDC
jgi:hypothetical protein